MKLFLLRHGIAVERGASEFPQDADRPLTAEGRRKTRKAARVFSSLDLEFDLILSSPFVRARETAELVAKEMGLRKELKLIEELKPETDPHQLVSAIGRIHPAPSSLLLVGHEPDLGRLVSLFVWGAVGDSVQLKKGGLVMLRTGRLRAGKCATLEWVLTPKHLLKMR
jgi:phosphohistidine phosphatase